MVAPMVKNLPAMQETGISSLGQEDLRTKYIFHFMNLWG